MWPPSRLRAAIFVLVVVGASLGTGPARVLSRGEGSAAEDPASAPLTFAVIGDYGVCGTRSGLEITCTAEKAVASLVLSWHPMAIFTTGDNSYESGSPQEVLGDQRPYRDYIDAGKFFPSFGNNDWGTGTLQPSLDFFRLKSPFYKKEFSAVLTAYLLDTNAQDPAGNSAQSTQGKWLAEQLAKSSTPWNIAFNHQAPYSSCGHGSSPSSRWVAAPGIDVVFSGHEHAYAHFENLNSTGSAKIPYVIIGASGAPLVLDCHNALPGQQKAIYGKFGAVKLVVTRTSLSATFVDLHGAALDSVTLTKPAGRVP